LEPSSLFSIHASTVGVINVHSTSIYSSTGRLQFDEYPDTPIWQYDIVTKGWSRKTLDSTAAQPVTHRRDPSFELSLELSFGISLEVA
jgi:hypothetical protein